MNFEPAKFIAFRNLAGKLALYAAITFAGISIGQQLIQATVTNYTFDIETDPSSNYTISDANGTDSVRNQFYLSREKAGIFTLPVNTYLLPGDTVVTREGTPTSIAFIGKIYGEAEMLALAKAYQDATGWHLRHPNLS